MLQHKELMEEGDLVVVFLDVRRLYPITLAPGQVFQSRYGALRHDDCMGRQFGSRIPCTKGWVWALHPTPELWTVCLPHRTQILYAADIALITAQLDLRPGSVVCEAGTGSGSLSHALARAVFPGGFVHSFDFHMGRVEVARREFAAHSLCTSVTLRDVCTDGFGLDGAADAIFLDLPQPWDALPHVTAAFRKRGGRICTFSPCVEQVQRTCAALRQYGCGFRDIVTVECLQRTYDVKRITQPAICFPEEDCSVPEESNSSGEANQLKTRKCATSANQKELTPGSVAHWAAIPPLQTPGHTGYLTYATYM